MKSKSGAGWTGGPTAWGKKGGSPATATGAPVNKDGTRANAKSPAPAAVKGSSKLATKAKHPTSPTKP